MRDNITKRKEEELINMVSDFCDANLNDEYKQLSINLVKKLGRKREVPFKRGALVNWASGVIYALAQLNFLFDKSFEPYLSADDICDFFDTKKSTVSDKARTIRRLVNIKQNDEEFLTQTLIDANPNLIQRPHDNFNLSAKRLDNAQRFGNLRFLVEMEKSLEYFDVCDFDNALKHVDMALKINKDDYNANKLKILILAKLNKY